MVDINEDVFSYILSYIFDTKTLYTLLAALPKSHRLFHVALAGLWRRTAVYLDAYDALTTATSQKVLDYLLDADAGHRPLAESIRHLVVIVQHDPESYQVPSFKHVPPDVTALHERLPQLFRRSVNLESLDYHGPLGMKREHVESLRHLERICAFAVDCALFYRGGGIPSAVGDYAAPGELSAKYDAEIWEIEPFVSTIGTKLGSLELRQVSQTMFTVLASRTDVFASYHALEHFKVDITEGVWDWGGGGSPAMGASPAFTFPFLGLPSVKRFELVVCDKTLSGSQKGPLNLVHCHLLTELSLDVRYSIEGIASFDIKLFEALSPWDLPVLSRLEIKDNSNDTVRYYWDADEDLAWRQKDREYLGLVPSFLGSMRTGSLPKLHSLWVDEKVLIPRDSSVQNLLGVIPSDSTEERLNNGVVWRETLGAAFERLESLRVGFGAITHLDAGLILGLCDPNKLKQFGFEWNWWDYGRDQPISAELLAHLARFPKLTDVHILFPRPETHLPGTPDPVVDARMLGDVASIFECNPNICRVGIGNSVVWERHSTEGPSAILLVSDGSIAPNRAVSKFYHAGFMPKYDRDDRDPDSDNATPPRPLRGEEISELKGLLQRILT